MGEKTVVIRRALVALLVSAVLLCVDQVTKYYVLLDLKPIGSFSVIPHFLEFSYVENRGAAFGLFQNSMWVISVFSIIAFIALILSLFRYKGHSLFSYCAVVLIFSGGVGNLIDRLRFGFVVDFIHVLFFDYIFNFADCCVTVGAVLLICHAVVLTLREKKQERDAGESEHE